MKPLKTSLILLTVTLAVAVTLPAQMTDSHGASNGIMLGTWNTQAEFNEVMVVSGTDIIFSDAFNPEISRWSRLSGEWHADDTGYFQRSGAMPALMRTTFTAPETNYTVSVRAKKLSGAEGFLVGFGARDLDNYYWLNVGGWTNSSSCLEKSVNGRRAPFGPMVKETVETGRWYEIRIAVTGERIQCFLDQRLILNVLDPDLKKTTP